MAAVADPLLNALQRAAAPDPQSAAAEAQGWLIDCCLIKQDKKGEIVHDHLDGSSVI